MSELRARVKSRRPALGINLSVVNGVNMQSPVNVGGQKKMEDPSPLKTTYRAEGLSIGQNYLRFEGSTMPTDLSPSDLIVDDQIIGRGSCSIVQRAHIRDDPQERKVALKIFIIRDVNCMDMMVKELRTLCSIQCDCLVSFMGAFFSPREAIITMVLEYMDKGSLLDILQTDRGHFPPTPKKERHVLLRSREETHVDLEISLSKGMPERIIASVAYQILWGVAFLHFENSIHRDIKPANILVNSSGEVKLSDFGISAIREPGETLNRTVVGTTLYMSPERLRAKPYGTPSDIWSVGLVLLECVTGQSPFFGISSVVELFLTIEEMSIEDFLPKSLSQEFTEVLAGCLESVPEKRIPAAILLESPWFAAHGINGLAEAVSIMKEYLSDTREVI